MEEVGGFLDGERDYRELQGGTGARYSVHRARLTSLGPLVYPAGFVYAYAALRWLTGGSVAAAQPLFASLYVLSAFLALRFTAAARALPPLLLPLLCLSKRLHSIYVLRLFNEALAMPLAWAMVLLAQRRRWLPAALAFSASVSVKMNALLFAPALALLMLLSCGRRAILLAASLAAALQLALAAPFLAAHPAAYLARAFEFGRAFEQRWSVNWQGLSSEQFASQAHARGLLLAHAAALLLFAHRRWAAAAGGLPGLARAAARALRGGAGAPLPPRAVACVLLEANLVGVAFARSLHFQFYAWYAQSLPLLAWSAALPGGPAARLLLLAALERVWNVYPPSRAASAQLHACHALLLLGLLRAGPLDLSVPPKRARRKQL